MRKIVLLFLLFMAVPAMAASNVTLSCTHTVVGDTNWVTVSYNSDTNLIRAFGLDLTVLRLSTDGNTYPDANITDVCNLDPNYRIYPGEIVITNGAVTDYNKPYALSDMADHNNIITVEMGSLYTTDANFASDSNMGYNKIPAKSDQLLKFAYKNGCYAKVELNARRGGIVMEDPYENPTFVSPLTDFNGCTQPPCPVPDVRGQTLAAANVNIIAASLITGPNIPEVNCATANGNVTRTDPVNGFAGVCGVTSVTKYYAQNPAAPGAASSPTPAAAAKCVSLTQVLSWTVGSDTNTQDIYFGTNSTPPLVVSSAPVSQTTYNPGALNVYTLYYWRVNERNVCGVVTTGTVYCFTTGPQAGKPCCSNEAHPCLGDVNVVAPYTMTTDGRGGDNFVRISDVTALTAFIGTLPGSLHRCSPVAGSGTCPPCYDMDGDGFVRISDLTALVTRVGSFSGSLHRHSCPYPACSNP